MGGVHVGAEAMTDDRARAGSDPGGEDEACRPCEVPRPHTTMRGLPAQEPHGDTEQPAPVQSCLCLHAVPCLHPGCCSPKRRHRTPSSSTLVLHTHTHAGQLPAANSRGNLLLTPQRAGINEDVLARLKAAEDEAAQLRKELAAAQKASGAPGGPDIIEAKPKRFDSVDNRETVFDFGGWGASAGPLALSQTGSSWPLVRRLSTECRPTSPPNGASYIPPPAPSSLCCRRQEGPRGLAERERRRLLHGGRRLAGRRHPRAPRPRVPSHRQRESTQRLGSPGGREALLSAGWGWSGSLSRHPGWLRGARVHSPRCRGTSSLTLFRPRRSAWPSERCSRPASSRSG